MQKLQVQGQKTFIHHMSLENKFENWIRTLVEKSEFKTYKLYLGSKGIRQCPMNRPTAPMINKIIPFVDYY